MDNQKVILVTGCSSGFGLLTAVRLAAQGHFVWATMRDLSKKQTLEDELAKRRTQAFIRELDVTRPSTIKNVVEEIQKTHFHVDVLVNNAGFGICGFFEDLSEAQVRSQMETNFFGVQNVCREIIPLMRKRNKGKIINISSVAGQTAIPCLSAYNSSKWALEGFSESLYYELGLFEIQVVLVEPGSYPTEIFTRNSNFAGNFNNDQGPYFRFNQKVRSFLQKDFKKLNRDPEVVAKMIENIINDPHPRLRYVSDFRSWLRILALRKLPAPLIAQFFRRVVLHG